MKNSSIPAHGIHGDIAGITVIVSGAETVSFPLIARIAAVKFWGAAAGVASTMSMVLVVIWAGLMQVGRKVRLNPELGNPSWPKQTWVSEAVGLIVVRFTDVLSPTLIVTADGSTVRLRPDLSGFESGIALSAGQG
jgi:hypothetical protein